MRNFMLSILALVLGVSVFASAAQAGDQKARAVLQRAIRAVGGEESLRRLKSPMMWMERGTYYGMGDGMPYVAQHAAKWPGWYRLEIEGTFTITVSDDKAWVTTPAGVEKLSGARLKEQLERVRIAWAGRLFPLTDEAYEVSTIDGIEVNGRPTVGIRAKHADGRDVRFFFDQETYLLSKLETTVVSSEYGPDPVSSEAFFTDHRSFGGVMTPARFKVYRDQKQFVEGETIDYKLFATLDPEQFEEP